MQASLEESKKEEEGEALRVLHEQRESLKVVT